jgi:hypothetical protein
MTTTSTRRTARAAAAAMTGALAFAGLSPAAAAGPGTPDFGPNVKTFEAGSGTREVDTPRGADEQRRAEPLLQPADLLADRRRGRLQPRRSPAEVPLLVTVTK